ncbi:MAG: response regulator [Burkholderiales bacterium]|nr:response regulator [Burkholderiales bacterium]
MSSTPVEKAFCTTTEAATLLGVSVGTVQLWVESGLLQAWKTAGGHRRVMRDSVQALLHKGSVVDANPVPLAMEPEVVTDGRRFTILVVEDDVKLLRMYEATLSRWPMQPKVITASSATAGLVSMGRFNPDMLITDLHMPGMDGFDMLRELDRMPETGQTVIVAVSGLDDDAIKAHGGVPVGVQVLPKPIPFVRLLDIANVALSLRKARSTRATSLQSA